MEHAALLALVLGLALAFSSLGSSVDEARIKVAFRFGWPAREIPIGSVLSHGAVRNKWWYGFGIRAYPGGWMYNVWGLDAVEVRYDTGDGPKAFRIGTDDPEGLVRAIDSARPLG